MSALPTQAQPRAPLLLLSHPHSPCPSCVPRPHPERGGRPGRERPAFVGGVCGGVVTSSSPQPCKVDTISPHFTDGEPEAQARRDSPEATHCRRTHWALSADLPDPRVPTQREDSGLASRSHRGWGVKGAGEWGDSGSKMLQLQQGWAVWRALRRLPCTEATARSSWLTPLWPSRLVIAANELACRGLDHLEEKIPALQYPPEKVSPLPLL